jgi:nascent polypeptide-associated complex subunit alpha
MFRGRIDPRKMKRMMKQMGIKTEELEGVREVVIKLPDKELVIPDAQVTLTEMGGQRTYQVVGEAQERKPEPEINEGDISLVMEQAGVERADAERALEEAGGDLAQAILKLKKG